MPDLANNGKEIQRQMSSILYLEGSSGISGDMTVAALLDLGGNRTKLDNALNSLQLDGFSYAISRKKSYGIAGCDFDVHLSGHPHEHDHDHESGHPHVHDHNHESDHPHEHNHNHEHRNLADVYAVIDRADITEHASFLAKKIFRIVAEAEAQAHGCALEEVHFHEVGAVDSIADIVAVSVLADDLGITECIVTGLSEGRGFVRCQHGELPVPVPAVLNIAKKYDISLRTVQVCGEMVTPTGIAIAAALRTRTELPAEYHIEKVGIGLGKRDFGRANILRVMLLREESNPEQVYLAECNIDDSTGETFGYAMEKLMQAGALDVHFIPCFMKKNRPAYLLRAIVPKVLLPEIERIIFETTTTIGLRKIPLERTRMNREEVEISLPVGKVKAKKCTWGNIVRCYPEYESVRQLADAVGIDFPSLFRQAQEMGESQIQLSGNNE